jgi:hypothetical protein
MVILRPTRKLHSLLPAKDIARPDSDTALGDWYVNRIVVYRQPLLLLLSSASLLPILVPARDVRTLPARLANLVETRLRNLRVPAEAIHAEIAAMVPVEIGPTIDRSVLGIMVDFAKVIPYFNLAKANGGSLLQFIEDRLADTPCHARSAERLVFPKDKTPKLLREKWLA